MTEIRALGPVETWQGLAKLRGELSGLPRGQGGAGAHIPSAPPQPPVPTPSVTETPAILEKATA